jgi:hypothetical protein
MYPSWAFSRVSGLRSMKTTGLIRNRQADTFCTSGHRHINHLFPSLCTLPTAVLPVSAIFHPISRIFPFSRGLFEDKVANFWCASNVLFKWKAWAPREFLVKLSTGLTALGFLPTVFTLLRAGFKHRLTDESDLPPSQKSAGISHSPFLPLLPYALLNSSMSFFLFSFQVHEKTILIPLLPITLLLSGAPVDSPLYSWGVLVNNTAVFRSVVQVVCGPAILISA